MSSSLPSSLQNLNPEALQRFRQIVQVPTKFDSTEEEQACQQVVDSLHPEDELPLVANVSYAHWVLYILKDPILTKDVTRQVALKITRWHLQSVGGNHVTKTLQQLQEAIQVRKEYHLDLFRTCFYNNNNQNDNTSSSPEEQAIREDIRNDLEKQLQIVLRNQDKMGRAVVIKLPRTDGGTTEDAYVRQQLYVAERAAAVTEYQSLGQQEKICAIFSLQNQNSRVAPSLSWQRRAMKVVQLIYPGRVGRVLVLDAGFVSRQLFAAIKPFLSASIRETTDLVSGSGKVEALKELLDDPDILTADGQLTKPVDIHRYLNDIPFYSSYEQE